MLSDTTLWHPFADMAAVRGKEFVVTRGEGSWIWDDQGQRYLDATAGLWFANVGHGRTEIGEAIAAQLAQIETYPIFNDLANPPALELADRLAKLAPMEDSKVLLTSGGGEGVDTAIKLSRRYWNVRGEDERHWVLSRRNSYHGTNGIGTSIGGIDSNREGFGPLLPSVRFSDHDSLEAVRAAFEELGPERIAAVIAEPVIGAGGVYPPEPGYLEGLAELCRETGALLICDSVICGFGRLGNWFGIERWDVTPDMIVFAKGVTSGYLPLGGVVVSGRVAEPFWNGAGPLRHGPTYSGHSACCAAALANIDLLASDDLYRQGELLERPLIEALAPLQNHPAVAGLRGGVGFLAAVELHPEVLIESGQSLMDVARLSREHGVLVRPLGSCLAVSPPLVASAEQIALIPEAIESALDRILEERPSLAV